MASKPPAFVAAKGPKGAVAAKGKSPPGKKPPAGNPFAKAKAPPFPPKGA